MYVTVCVYIYIDNIFHTHHHGTVFSNKLSQLQQSKNPPHLQRLTKSHFITQQHSTATMKSKRQTLLDTENFGLETPPKKKRLHLKKWRYFWECLKIYPNSVVPLKMYSDLLEQPQKNVCWLSPCRKPVGMKPHIAKWASLIWDKTRIGDLRWNCFFSLLFNKKRLASQHEHHHHRRRRRRRRRHHHHHHHHHHQEGSPCI